MAQGKPIPFEIDPGTATVVRIKDPMDKNKVWQVEANIAVLQVRILDAKDPATGFPLFELDAQLLLRNRLETGA